MATKDDGSPSRDYTESITVYLTEDQLKRHKRAASWLAPKGRKHDPNMSEYTRWALDERTESVEEMQEQQQQLVEQAKDEFRGAPAHALPAAPDMSVPLHAPPPSTHALPAAPPMPASKWPLEQQAAWVLSVARGLPPEAWFGEKVFIGAVWHAVTSSWGADRATFDGMLLEANRQHLLRLSRADLVSVMDPTLVRESEVSARVGDARFHFIVAR